MTTMAAKKREQGRHRFLTAAGGRKSTNHDATSIQQLAVFWRSPSEKQTVLIRRMILLIPNYSLDSRKTNRRG